MKKNDPPKIETDVLNLRKNDTSAFIGEIPNSFLYFGIPVTVLFITVIIIGMFFLKYPEVIVAYGEVTTMNVSSIENTHNTFNELSENSQEKVQQYLMEIKLSYQSYEMIKIGQDVSIKLDDFPYIDYGILNGSINKISLADSSNFYNVEIFLPAKAITSYGKNIYVKSGLKGTCEIMTRRQRLIFKFLNPLKR